MSCNILKDADPKLAVRISKCGLVAHTDRVELARITGPDGVRASFSGLVTCSSVWACPCCSHRISEKRRQELNQLLAWAREAGHEVVMLTLTMQHKRGDDLSALLDGMKLATKAMRQSRAWRGLPLVGTVTATEVTHGANGWHPHQHILMVLRSGCDAVEAVEAVRSVWGARLKKQGFDCNEKGFDVQSASAAGNYVAKFGAAEELALGNAKRGRNGSRTPWQLLADARDGDGEAVHLFREYALAFKGRRQLHWSHGLKALAGVDDVSDEEAQADEGEREVLRVWSGSGDYWRLARRRRCALLDAAETGSCLDAAEFGPTDAERWRQELLASRVLE